MSTKLHPVSHTPVSHTPANTSASAKAAGSNYGAGAKSTSCGALGGMDKPAGSGGTPPTGMTCC